MRHTLRGQQNTPSSRKLGPKGARSQKENQPAQQFLSLFVLDFSEADSGYRHPHLVQSNTPTPNRIVATAPLHRIADGAASHLASTTNECRPRQDALLPAALLGVSLVNKFKNSVGHGGRQTKGNPAPHAPLRPFRRVQSFTGADR